jgi:hypothetical protein
MRSQFCLCVSISPYILSIVVFHTALVVAKESSRLVLPRTYCILDDTSRNA